MVANETELKNETLADSPTSVLEDEEARRWVRKMGMATIWLSYPKYTDSESAGEIISGSSFEKGSYVKSKELDCKAQTGALLASPRKLGVEYCKLNEANVSSTEEDYVCPTCFEDYDAKNPKNITKCNHHYHLSCILEWMERSDTCPICNQEKQSSY